MTGQCSRIQNEMEIERYLRQPEEFNRLVKDIRSHVKRFSCKRVSADADAGIDLLIALYDYCCTTEGAADAVSTGRC